MNLEKPLDLWNTCNCEYFFWISICFIGMIIFTNAVVYLLIMCMKFLMYQVLLYIKISE